MSIESSSPDRLPTAETILRDLGQSGASGVLEINHPAGEMSHVWVRVGRIYAMQVPGYRPALGIRLLSGGLVSPEQLSAAAAEQRDRFPGHLIGQVLVGMGFVDAQVIDAFVRDQVRDQVADLLDLEVVSAEFHAGRHVRQDIIEPTDIDQLLAVARENRDRRADVLDRVGGAHVTPVLGPPGHRTRPDPAGPLRLGPAVPRGRPPGPDRAGPRLRVHRRGGGPGRRRPGDDRPAGDPHATARGRRRALAPVVALHPPTEPEDPQWRFDGTDAGEPDPVAASHPDAPPGTVERAAGRVRCPAARRPRPRGGRPRGPGRGGPRRPSESPPDARADAAIPQSRSRRRPPWLWSSRRPSLPWHWCRPGPAPAPDPRGRLTPSGAHGGRSLRGDRRLTARSDTTAFMRELSSLSDDPDKAEPVVTRLVVPLTEHRRKRRPWGR